MIGGQPVCGLAALWFSVLRTDLWGRVESAKSFAICFKTSLHSLKVTPHEVLCFPCWRNVKNTFQWVLMA
jgi:phosphoserine aminotransferase